MSSRITAHNEEMIHAETLPQADASSLVDAGELEAKVKEMYGQVAREEEAELHFEVGRDLASHLGYPDAGCSTRSRPTRWPRSRASATTSTSPRSSRASPCSTSARAPGPTCSVPACRSAPARRGHRRRLHARAARQGHTAG